MSEKQREGPVWLVYATLRARDDLWWQWTRTRLENCSFGRLLVRRFGGRADVV